MKGGGGRGGCCRLWREWRVGGVGMREDVVTTRHGRWLGRHGMWLLGGRDTARTRGLGAELEGVV